MGFRVWGLGFRVCGNASLRYDPREETHDQEQKQAAGWGNVKSRVGILGLSPKPKSLNPVALNPV